MIVLLQFYFIDETLSGNNEKTLRQHGDYNMSLARVNVLSPAGVATSIPFKEIKEIKNASDNILWIKH